MTTLVERVLDRAGVHRERIPSRVHFEQVGEIALRPGKWQRFRARQSMDVRACAFRWEARVRMAPLVHVRVVDTFVAGHGLLDARLWRLFRLARAMGPEIDQSELLRYLAEVPFCPHALLANGQLTTVGQDADTLLVRTTIAGKTLEMTLTVDPQGDVISSRTAARGRYEEGRLVDHPWGGTFHDHETHAGLRVPTRCHVYWYLDEGPQEVFRATLSNYQLEYDDGNG
jgi:hypothetical protein